MQTKQKLDMNMMELRQKILFYFPRCQTYITPIMPNLNILFWYAEFIYKGFVHGITPNCTQNLLPLYNSYKKPFII